MCFVQFWWGKTNKQTKTSAHNSFRKEQFTKMNFVNLHSFSSGANWKLKKLFLQFSFNGASIFHQKRKILSSPHNETPQGNRPYYYIFPLFFFCQMPPSERKFLQYNIEQRLFFNLHVQLCSKIIAVF